MEYNTLVLWPRCTTCHKSGLIFRADIATGDEGEEISIIFAYPWEVF